jgi:hypothetical protein
MILEFSNKGSEKYATSTIDNPAAGFIPIVGDEVIIHQRFHRAAAGSMTTAVKILKRTIIIANDDVLIRYWTT